MERETHRIHCVGDDGSALVVVAYQHVEQRHTDVGLRNYPGARRLALATGEPVRVIDATIYQVNETGELLRRIE